jgi:hypothetical protein
MTCETNKQHIMYKKLGEKMGIGKEGNIIIQGIK